MDDAAIRQKLSKLEGHDPRGCPSPGAVWWSDTLGDHFYANYDFYYTMRGNHPCVFYDDAGLWVPAIAKPAGECDDRMKDLLRNSSHWCTRPLGHRGWHQENDGVRWRSNGFGTEMERS